MVRVLGRVAVGVLLASAATGCSRVSPSEAVTVNDAHYRLAWHDEFNGSKGRPPDPHHWKRVTGGGGWGNRELEDYTASPGNVSLNGRGDLAITARRERVRKGRGARWRYTSARLQTQGLVQLRYGRIEARIKVPLEPGLWPAFWMLGTDHARVGWPRSGELDVMELKSQKPFRVVGTVHGPSARKPSGWQINRFGYSSTSFGDFFHVYGLDWSPDKLVWTVDGRIYGGLTRQGLPRGDRWVFNRPFYMLLNLAVGGFWVGPPTSATRFPATMLVDWVRVWKRTSR
jgi:beta-glucanase (GH16 family)